jgi:hypothetical protein
MQINLTGQKLVSPDLVKRCNNFSDVLHLTIQQSPIHRSYASWSDLLDMRVSDFTCVINSDYSQRRRNIDPNKLPDLMREAQNLAPLQWLVYAMRGELVCQQIERDEPLAQVGGLH